MAKNTLLQNKVLVEEKKLADQLTSKGYGERKGKQVVLDLKEALYLLEGKKIEIVDEKGKKIGEKKLREHAQAREARFYSKYTVYKDLRERGYCTKTGFKFGFDFRVYPRGKKIGEAHTQWVVKVMTQDDRIGMIPYSRMVRLSQNIRAKLLIAVVDSENDINYYESERITP